MRYWELKVYDGFSNRSRIIRAASYSEAVRKSGSAGYPPGYIWSIEECQ